MGIVPKTLLQCALGLVAAVMMGAANLPAADAWPQFRGPDGQGHAVASQLPATWSEDENVRWKTAIDGLGWSSPVVAGNRVWLTTSVDEKQSLRLLCLDRDSGKQLYEVEVFRADDLGRIASKNSHASPTPVVDGRNVFVHYGAHGTACLTVEGEMVWSRHLEYDQRHGPGGSPVVWNDLLIVSCDGMDVQYTIALDKRTGEVRWESDHPGLHAYSTPLVIDEQGTPQLITSGGENLIAYAPADGRELWRYRHGGHSVVPRPVAGNGMVYFCTGYWTPTLVAVRTGGSGDVTDSHLAYRIRHSVPHTPSPVLIGKHIYFVSDQGVLTCADALTGEELWRERLGGSFSASLTLADGKIYCLDEEGTMYVLAAGDKFEKLAESHLEGRTLATPAFVENAIYLRTDSHLYRIESGSATAPRNIKAGATISRDVKPRFLR